MPTREETRAFEQQLKEKLKKDRKPSLVAKYKNAIQVIISKGWQKLDYIAKPISKGIIWAAPRLARPLWKGIIVLSCKKNDITESRQFNIKYFGLNILKIGIVVTILYAFATPIYYYGTWTTYDDIYVPSTGVFVNQQYVQPSAPGQAIAPRDEIYTVLAHTIDADGTVEPIRFDIDTNLLFWFYSDSLRPDLAAAKLTSRTPYGVKCTLEATGFYNRLPRYIRLWPLKWWDFRPEIVKVVKVEELQASPQKL